MELKTSASILSRSEYRFLELNETKKSKSATSNVSLQLQSNMKLVSGKIRKLEMTSRSDNWMKSMWKFTGQAEQNKCGAQLLARSSSKRVDVLCIFWNYRITPILPIHHLKKKSFLIWHFLPFLHDKKGLTALSECLLCLSGETRIFWWIISWTFHGQNGN